MRFKVEHTFRGIDLPAYEKLYFDEPFNVELCRATRLERTLVKLETKGKKIERVVRVAPEREVPAPVAKVLGASKLEYEEHLTYELGTYVVRWHTEPAILRDRILSSGTFTFQARPGGVARIVDGTVEVKIFGVGGIVERFVVADVEKSYQRAADFTQRWIDQHQGTAS